MFNSTKINDHLISLGWTKNQIDCFKEGMADSISGNWRDDWIKYNYRLGVKAPPDQVEEAYTAGHYAGEELINIWLEKLDSSII